jgi:hypothetical protein
LSHQGRGSARKGLCRGRDIAIRSALRNGAFVGLERAARLSRG